MKYYHNSKFAQPLPITEDEAEKLYIDFNIKVKRDFNGNRSLNGLSLRDVDGIRTLCGSAPLILPIVQEIVAPRKVGRPQDFQIAINEKSKSQIKWKKQNNYSSDMGLVMDFSGCNHEIAVDFWNQLPRELKALDYLPAVISGYRIRNLGNVRYGLGLVYDNKETQVHSAKLLAHETFDFEDRDVSLESGLPTKINPSGNRTLFTSKQERPSIENLGISKLTIQAFHDIYANDPFIYQSSQNDRLVLF